MKRLLILILMIGMMTAAFAFSGEISGETRVDVERNMVTDENLYTIDAGVVYTMDWLVIGADVKIDSNDDLDIGLPVTATFGNLIFKGEPGADNLRIDTIYVFDGDISYTFGVVALSYGFGYGTDEVLDMSAEITATIPGVVFNVKWFDADDVSEDILGIVEAGVTVKY